MGLFVYVRHTSDCANRDDRFYRRCRCPKWIRGTLDGREIRKSAKTRSWEKADRELRKVEQQAEEASTPSVKPAAKEPITVQHAVDRFLASKKNSELGRIDD